IHFAITATPPYETYTLSLHDALPICVAADAAGGGDGRDTCLAARRDRHDRGALRPAAERRARPSTPDRAAGLARRARAEVPPARSEEHTSELQSRSDLVCRLLLEKKK